MDGRSHHNHQKRDLQVSRKGWLTRARGIKANKDGSKRELIREMILLKCSYVYMLVSCVLSATDANYV
jgi:hypothetical protein